MVWLTLQTFLLSLKGPALYSALSGYGAQWRVEDHKKSDVISLHFDSPWMWFSVFNRFEQHLRFNRADLVWHLYNIFFFLALEAGLMPVSLGNKLIPKRLMAMVVS